MRVQRKKITAESIDAQHLRLLVLSAWLLTLFPLFPQTEISDGIVPIAELNSRNSAFKQLERAVQASYRLIAFNRGKKDGKKDVPVSFFSYTVKKNDTLLIIAARCSIRYETIATLNRILSPSMNISGTMILIPSCPGLFIPEKPKTPFESLLKKKCFPVNDGVWYTVRDERFFFIPDGKLNPTERAFFLDSSMKSPLPLGILTSEYGLRVSPISGVEKFHNGIDLAAPEGTEVYACKAGIVERTGSNPVYGNFVIIGHDERVSSFYAHLSAVHVFAGDVVNSGGVIGLVGTTGASTGPHLHFEVLSDGKGIDPVKVLGREQIRKNGGA